MEDFSKKPFVFVFQLAVYSAAPANILSLLYERRIEVQEFHYHAAATGHGRLMIHCQMERDRIGRTASQLNKLPGVLELDYMESKKRL